MRLKIEPRTARPAAFGLAFVTLLLCGLEKPMNANENDIETRNKRAVRLAFDAWTQGAGSPFDLLKSDAKWTIVGNAPVSRTYNSKQEFLDVVIKPFNARMSQRLVPTVRQIYADGDTVIALFD